jgi:hypothetical protein
MRLEREHGGAPQVLGPAHRHRAWTLKLGGKTLDPEVDPLIGSRWIAWVRSEEHIPAAV